LVINRIGILARNPRNFTENLYLAGIKKINQMKKLFTTLVLVVAAVFNLQAQENVPPVLISEGRFVGETIPLRDMETAPLWEGDPVTALEIPMSQQVQGRLSSNALPIGGDPLLQTEPPFRSASNLLQSWEGGDIGESGGVLPPDPTGAAGPDHYVHAFNLRVKIFDKEGNLEVGPVPLGTFLGSGNNDGDPIVMYDQLADRYFVSQFRVSDNALIIGVSTTPDPTGTYYVYEYTFSSFPDYPHYTVWPDGYYLSANKPGIASYAFERDVMLVGGESPQLRGFILPGLVLNPVTVNSWEPAHLLGYDYEEGLPGYFIYLQDDSWGGIDEDHIKIWSIDLDWSGGPSSVSEPQEIAVAPFDSTFQPFGTGDIEQPGTSQKLDGVQGVISYMSNYRAFEDHNSLLINFNVDIDGNDTAGVRWIEFRNTGSETPWTLYQEGTYNTGEGDSNFMGSLSMDEEGNIGLAYSVGSAATNLSIRYTGRMAGDPLGQMTFPETSIIEGNGVQTFSNRQGDYAQMVMDVNNRTFWHTAQYFQVNNSWATRIGAFRFIDDYTNDVGVYAIQTPWLAGPYGEDEEVTVSIYNFGTDSQSNFDVELLVDGNVVATETFTGTIDAESFADFTFTQDIDISLEGVIYNVEARTALAGDEYEGNDGFDRDYLFGELLGITEATLVDGNLLVYPVQDRTYELNYKTAGEFENMNYRVVNLAGQVIHQGIMQTADNGFRAQIDMAAQADGVYIFEVTNGDQRAFKKLLVR